MPKYSCTVTATFFILDPIYASDDGEAEEVAEEMFDFDQPVENADDIQIQCVEM